jgi:hypothetical protein
MVNPGTNILILFAIATGLAFFFPLWKDQVYKRLSPKSWREIVKPSILVMLPFVALFGLAGFLGCPVGVTLPCFIGAMASFLLCVRSGLTPQLASVLLLVAAVGFTFKVPADNVTLALSAAMMGLLVGKGTDSLLLSGERSLEDVIAPLSWLSGVLWLSTLSQSGVPSERQGLLMGVISVCLLLRIFGRPFMTDDRWLLKRIILATTGGLAVLMVITKLLYAMDLAPLSILVGAGMFATYLFQNVDIKKDEPAAVRMACINLLIVVAALTMVATRIFGMYGLVVLVPSVLIAPRFSIAQFIGAFFAVRVLVQVFVSVYNSNVTGINIMHAYTGAAEYAGLLCMAVVAVLLRDVKNKPKLLALTLGTSAVVPIAANYYLHAEPTSSLLVAACAAAGILAVLGPVLQADGAELRYENLLLSPAIMSVVGITYSGLLDAGNNATNEFKTTVLGYGIGGVVLCSLVGYLVFKHLSRTRAGRCPAPAGDK